MAAIENQGDEVSGEFPFIGEALALDLVNTQVVVRGRPGDLLAAPGALAAWWRAARSHYPDAGLASDESVSALDAAALLATAQELRAALRAIFSAVVDGRRVAEGDLAVPNRILRGGYEVLAADSDGRLHSCTGSHAAGPDAALLPIARSAFTLLTGTDLARLHLCANDRCVLLFYDTTKSATRRWCSVACMNRARSRRRFQERKVAAAAAAVPGMSEEGDAA